MYVVIASWWGILAMGRKLAPIKDTKLFAHCLTFYNAMDFVATYEKAGEVTVRVYRGYMTHVFRECGIPPSYYSVIKTKLERLGCIEVLQAGARATESVVALHESPSAVEWPERDDKPSPKLLTNDPDFATLSGRVKTIEQAIGGINLAKALIAIESRLHRLETMLGVKGE